MFAKVLYKATCYMPHAETTMRFQDVHIKEQLEQHSLVSPKWILFLPINTSSMYSEGLLASHASISSTQLFHRLAQAQLVPSHFHGAVWELALSQGPIFLQALLVNALHSDTLSFEQFLIQKQTELSKAMNSARVEKGLAGTTLSLARRETCNRVKSKISLHVSAVQHQLESDFLEM